MALLLGLKICGCGVLLSRQTNRFASAWLSIKKRVICVTLYAAGKRSVYVPCGLAERGGGMTIPTTLYSPGAHFTTDVQSFACLRRFPDVRPKAVGTVELINA